MRKVAARAVKDIKDFIGVSCQVVVKKVGEIPRSQGKAVRVVDHRKK
jgi:phenylacetate-CoA ligase